MSLPFWKVPNITNIQIGNLILSRLIHGRDTDGASVHITPFCLWRDSITSTCCCCDIAYHSMPMKLSQRAFGEMLLSSSDIPAGRQIGHDLFSHPAPGKEPCFGVGEAPFKVGNYTVIRPLCTEVIWILQIQCFVCSA